MTKRELFIAALERKAPAGRVPHFELEFLVTLHGDATFSLPSGDDMMDFIAQLVSGYREMGFYVIKHTDGNIMPILDSLVSTNPHALHSIDPQGGVDLSEVKRLVGDRVCLIGNVNSALLQTGSDEEAVADIRRALTQGMPGGADTCLEPVTVSTQV